MSQTVADSRAAGPQRYSPKILRRWSDAFAGAGLFSLALRVYPDDHEYPIHRAELAVLASDHAAALRLLKEHDTVRDHSVPAEPAFVLLTAVARAQAGQPSAWQDVQNAAKALPATPWRAWMIALGGIAMPHLTVPHLGIAGPAARRAFEGGCRDPRLPVIAAAGVIADGERLTWEQCAEAVRLLEHSRRVQLPGEDSIGGLLDLLRRAGLVERAQSLAAFAAGDDQVAREVREAWRAAAHAQHIHVPRRLSVRPGKPHLPHHTPKQRDIICRCAGSTGWIGPDRLHYLQHHLKLVDAAPLPDLTARLLRCQLTGVRFLDLIDLQLTLPVDAEGRRGTSPAESARNRR